MAGVWNQSLHISLLGPETQQWPEGPAGRWGATQLDGTEIKRLVLPFAFRGPGQGGRPGALYLVALTCFHSTAVSCRPTAGSLRRLVNPFI